MMIIILILLMHFDFFPTRTRKTNKKKLKYEFVQQWHHVMQIYVENVIDFIGFDCILFLSSKRNICKNKPNETTKCVQINIKSHTHTHIHAYAYKSFISRELWRWLNKKKTQKITNKIKTGPLPKASKFLN